MPAALPHSTLFPTPVPTPYFPRPGSRVSAHRRLARRRRPAASWLLALLLLLLSGAATTARAQATPPAAPPECSQDEKFANTWYFGYKAGLDFNQATDSIPPKVLTDGQMTAPAGAGVMSDGNGKILFYSNGDTIWNGNHTIMTNGSGMGGNRLVTDGPLPIRMPGSPPVGMPGGETRYLIFTQDAAGGPKGLSYSEIVIPAGGGPGTVTLATKNTPLTQGTTEKMTAVFHKNGCDIWIIVHGWGNAKEGFANRGDAFLAYRVRTTGVDRTPIISTVGSLHAASVSPMGYRGQMKVTPDGQRLAVARYSEVVGDSSSTVELFSFDTSTGQVSANPQQPYIVDSGEGKYYGVDFSAGSKLYATVMNPPKLLQFNISGNGPVNKQSIPLKQTNPVNLGSLQAAPDGKIYVARENQPALGFITYPDSVGAKARYADDSLTLQLSGRRSGLGLVNFNQSSLLRVGFGAQSTACLEITFTAPPIDFDSKTYAWSFGDGTTSAEENPKHTYAALGDYTVTLRITTNCFCRESTSTIRVPGAPTPGSIGANQTLCAGSAAAPLISTAGAGAGTGQFSYRWESSSDNTNWGPASGTITNETYAPGLLTATTYFRRQVSSGFCPPLAPTNVVTINVLPALTAGSIAADQTVCAGGAIAQLTSTAATGGTGTFVYQWEESLDNSTWRNTQNGTGETLAPSGLTATTFFRRRVTSGPCAALSNTVVVTILPALTAGSIAADQTLCAGSTPNPLISNAPAASGTGTITYLWELSTDNSTWTSTGATGPTYAPDARSATTYYRRRASSGSCGPVFSNVVTITVTPALLAGTIGTDQTVCAGSTAAPLTSTAPASGGTGTFVYQWQSSPDNTSWVLASGAATSETYAPGAPTVTTYYRRQVSSGPCVAFTNSVAITVTPALAAGTIGTDQNVCAGSTAAPLTSTAPASGGTGTFVYRWQSSPDNTSWVLASGAATSETYAPGAPTVTTYYRRQVSSGTCATGVSNVVTIRVTPLVTPSVSLATPPVQCAGTALTFTAVAANAGTAPTFQWFVNNVAVASGPTFTSSTLATGDQVRVEVTPTAGLCSTGPAAATVTVTRTATTPPTLAIAVQPNAPVCPGEPLTFSITSVTGAGPTPTYQWQVNGNDVAGATTPVFTTTTLRDGQTVTLRLRTTDVCGQPATAVSNGVAVRILPPVVVNAGPDKEILEGSRVTLEGTADGTYPVTWTPALGLTIPPSNPLRPEAAPLVTTTYTLSGGVGGCASSDQVTVTVRPAIRIPNAFTPNGDGRDDTWQIEFIEQFPDNTVTVFNRWGNKIFSAENYSRANEWRGDISGQPAPVGTYYYVVVTKGPLGRSYAGSITILY
jgi:gliding motility-associated-like protein